MSGIHRSRSAPHVGGWLGAADSLYLQPSERHDAPRRTKTTLDLLSVPPSPRRSTSGRTTPRAEREDPFNLGGFFPAQLRTDDTDEQEWSWLRYGSEEEAAEYDEQLVATWGPGEEEELTAEGLFGALDKADTGAAIQDGDKLGILSILGGFSTEGEMPPVEDRLYSPYGGDEACDEESLHMLLCARRAEQEGRGKACGASTPFGALFLPGKREERLEAQEASSWGIPGVMYEGLQLLCGVF